MLNIYTTVQLYIEACLFFITHLYKLPPFLYAADIVGQHYPVIKRQILATEYFYVIFTVEGTVTFYKAASPCACANYHHFLPHLFIQLHLHRRKLEVRFFLYGVDQVAGQVVCPVQVVVQDFAPMHG